MHWVVFISDKFNKQGEGISGHVANLAFQQLCAEPSDFKKSLKMSKQPLILISHSVGVRWEIQYNRKMIKWISIIV